VQKCKSCGLRAKKEGRRGTGIYLFGGAKLKETEGDVRRLCPGWTAGGGKRLKIHVLFILPREGKGGGEAGSLGS